MKKTCDHDFLKTQIENAVQTLAFILLEKKWKLTCAESCTGGGLGFFLTNLPGSSQWFDGGFITYSNHNKIQQLNIPESLLQQCGAVSQETALAMAKQSRERTQTDLSIAITGIAGPEGGSAEKPVGLVWFGIDSKQGAKAIQNQFSGDRQAIRLQSILFSVELAIAHLKKF